MEEVQHDLNLKWRKRVTIRDAIGQDAARKEGREAQDEKRRRQKRRIFQRETGLRADAARRCGEGREKPRPRTNPRRALSAPYLCLLRDVQKVVVP